MAILTDEYVLYDTEGHFYYLSEAGAVHYTGKTHIPNMWQNAQWRLKNMGEMLYNDYTHNVYNAENQPRYRPLDHIEYNVYLNQKDERKAIIRALTLFAIAADDTDLDIEIMSGEKMLPEHIRKPMKRNIYFKGRYSGYVEEDVWRVDY